MSSEQKSENSNFDPKTGTYRSTYNYPAEPPSVAVTLALVEATGKDVTDLDPLYDESSLDPDALDDLFRPTGDAISRECRVTFTYHDFTITVEGWGRVVVWSSEDWQERRSNQASD